MEEKFEMFKSQRGGDLLVYEDHMYNCDYNRDGGATIVLVEEHYT
jgi:hypothetical protein